MFVYDQINMALVTGPVAMLFWVLLGLGDSYDEPTAGDSTVSSTSGKIAWSAAWTAAGTLAVTTVAFLTLVWIPVTRGNFSWDPDPWELDAMKAKRVDDNSVALTAINEAIARAPRSTELRINRIFLEQERPHQPVAEEIRAVLQLDQANARLRLALLLPDSDLPPAERAAMLQEALWLDSQLPDGEIKRLSKEEREMVQRKIDELGR